MIPDQRRCLGLVHLAGGDKGGPAAERWKTLAGGFHDRKLARK